jgi:hypothetical protein
MVYRFLADIVLVLHAAVVAFVVLGLLLVLVGRAMRWTWVRNFWFRMAHLLAILFVVLQSYIGIVCPLTTWENALRLRGGQQPYDDGGCIRYWLHHLMFYQAEDWVFATAYTVFALAVVEAFVLAPPCWPGAGKRTKFPTS